MKKIKRALVTGGAGFIGSHVVDALIKKGLKIVVIDDLSTGSRKNINPKAKFYKLDIRSKNLDAIFKKERPDYVFHLAAQMDVRKSVADPVFDADINILGTLNLLENSVAHKVKKIIFSSSGGAVYGETDKIPTSEAVYEKSISPYGVSKLSAEKYLYFYENEYGLPYVSLRYANVYGPRQRSDGEAGVVAIFTKKILAGEQPIINGDGKNTRDYVYVEDVARANVLALRKKARGAYNVGTGKETTVNQIFKKIVKISQIKMKEVHGPAKPGEQRRSSLSYAKIKKELGWQPKVNLDEGLKKTFDYIKRT